MNRRKQRATTPLANTSLHVTIIDLIAEYTLSHLFRNEGEDAIEAVYSFPVPLDSAFMGMEATLAGEQLVAQVTSRQRATRKYDDAIAEGDSAVLLESLEPGMLCVNLGNLKPGEEGEVVLRFAAPLQTADATARFSLPLVHRPRYGRSSLDEREEPQHDFAAEHPLEASIRVEGLLARAAVSCASHGARFSADGDAQVLRLNQAMLDRDVVLVFDLPADLPPTGRLVRDDERAIGVISFATPHSPGSTGLCDICLVLDGSGSMSGDAIAQSREALRSVVGALKDEDRIQILRFGSTVVPMFRRPLKASVRVRGAIDALADTIDADLGGTDMEDALDSALVALEEMGPASGRNRAIILVTDGAVHSSEVKAVESRAVAAGIRIFVVAVGSSAGADVLGPLAAGTGAVLERAVPAEPIDEAVMRQFRRVREAGPIQISIDWGTQDAQPLPLDVAYNGDAVTAMALLPAGRGFSPRVRLEEGSAALTFDLEVAEEAPALRALAGHRAWQHAIGEDRVQLAVRYSLITDDTSAVMVKVRSAEDKAESLPTVVPVAHMTPSGMVRRSLGSVSLSPASASLGRIACYSVFEDSYGSGFFEVARIGLEHESAGDKLPFDRVAELRAVLRNALETLLLTDALHEFNIESLFEVISSDLHDDLNRYLRELSIDLSSVSDAVELFEGLLDEAPRLTLTDDQEARLSELKYGVSADA